MLLFSRPWDEQPESAVEIDWSNPHTKDLVFASLPTAGIEVVSGKSAKFLAGGGVAGSDGALAFATSADTAGIYWDDLGTDHPVWTIGTEFTVLSLSQLTSSASYGALFNIGNNAGNTDPYNALGLVREATGTDVRLHMSTAAGVGSYQVSYSATGFLIFDQQSRDYWLARNGSSVRFYRDGELHSVGTSKTDPAIGAASVPYFANHIPPAIFGISSTTGSTTGKNSNTVVWKREVPADELAEIRRTLNQLFKPKEPRIWMAVSAVGAATFAAAASASATGTASLATGIALSANSAAVMSATAVPTTAVSLTANANAATTATATLSTQVSLSAGATAQALGAAALATQIPLTADARAIASASADLAVGVVWASVATAKASASAELTTGIALAAVSSASATSSASLTTAIQLAAIAVAQAQATAALTVPLAGLSASAAASSSASAILTTQILLAAQAGARVSVAADLLINRTLVPAPRNIYVGKQRITTLVGRKRTLVLD